VNVDRYDDILSSMDEITANLIRNLRVEKHYTWRSVADVIVIKGIFKVRCSEQLFGQALCHKAAQFFNENYLTLPWNR